MKKLIALTLAILMALALAACGGSADTQQTPDSGTPTNSDETPNNTATDTNGNGDIQQTPTGSDDPTPTPTRPVPGDIPDNGTPPDVPALFESHEGDRGYFYVTTDDYMVYRYDVESYPRPQATHSDTWAWDYGPCIYYHVMSFNDTDYSSFFSKWVFADEADAQSFADAANDRIAVGNVVYITEDSGWGGTGYIIGDFFGKERHVNGAYSLAVWAGGGDFHLSDPAGFEELLADGGMRGKTGQMTLGEAFADAAFLLPTDAHSLNLDETNFILHIFHDGRAAFTDAEIYFFDGDQGAIKMVVRAFADGRPQGVSEWELTDSKSSMQRDVWSWRSRGELVYVGT